MTPKDKAEQLVEKFLDLEGAFYIPKEIAKDCALICCESHLYSENDSPFAEMWEWEDNNQYWREVKAEILKL